MGEIVKAKLFTHGGSQAVRLPKAFRFDASEVRVRRLGTSVILEPLTGAEARDWAEYWKRIDELRIQPSSNTAEAI